MFEVGQEVWYPISVQSERGWFLEVTGGRVVSAGPVSVCIYSDAGEVVFIEPKRVRGDFRQAQMLCEKLSLNAF